MLMCQKEFAFPVASQSLRQFPTLPIEIQDFTLSDCPVLRARPSQMLTRIDKTSEIRAKTPSRA